MSQDNTINQSVEKKRKRNVEVIPITRSENVKVFSGEHKQKLLENVLKNNNIVYSKSTKCPESLNSLVGSEKDSCKNSLILLEGLILAREESCWTAFFCDSCEIPFCTYTNIEEASVVGMNVYRYDKEDSSLENLVCKLKVLKDAKLCLPGSLIFSNMKLKYNNKGTSGKEESNKGTLSFITTIKVFNKYINMDFGNGINVVFSHTNTGSIKESLKESGSLYSDKILFYTDIESLLLPNNNKNKFTSIEEVIEEEIILKVLLNSFINNFIEYAVDISINVIDCSRENKKDKKNGRTMLQRITTPNKKDSIDFTIEEEGEFIKYSLEIVNRKGEVKVFIKCFKSDNTSPTEGLKLLVEEAKKLFR